MPQPTEFPDVLETERLTLRAWRLEDAEALWAIVDASRPHLARWLPWEPFYRTPADAHAFVRRARGEFDLRQDFKFAIVRRADGALLGGTGLHRFDWEHRRFEIGYWLGASATGQGYMTEATAGLVRFCFDALDARRVEIFVDTENTASRAVPERLGVPFEGVGRQALWIHGEARDRAVYAMTRGDYDGWGHRGGA